MNDSLDITRDALRELSRESVALVMDYFERVSELPVFPDTSAAQIREQLETSLPTEGEPLERLIEDCRVVVKASRQNGHPRFFGYVASPATPIGAFADLIASALNQNVPVWRSAPAATHIERTTVRWLAELIGYPHDAGGLLTSGGSMANLDALYIAQRTKARGKTSADTTANANDASLIDDQALLIDSASFDVSRHGLWHAGAPMTVY